MSTYPPYKSITLSSYIIENEVIAIEIVNVSKFLLLTKNDGTEEKFYFSSKIDQIDHVGLLWGYKDHLYSVILNGLSNKNWVWRYTDLVVIADF